MSITQAGGTTADPEAAKPAGDPLKARAPQPRQERARWRSRMTRFDMVVTPYLLIAPFFLLFAVFGLFPLLYNGVVSLRTWRLDDPSSDGWAGFANYTKLFHDEDFWHALVNTLGIFVLSTVPQLTLALIIASLLNRRLRFRTGLRVGVLLPYITPLAASTLIFQQLFGHDYGIINSILGGVGLGPVDWLQRTDLSGRDAVGPEGPLRGCRAGRGRSLASAAADHRADDPAHPHLHHRAGHDRTDAAVHGTV